MKREFDMRLTYDEIEIIESVLRDELEFRIFTDTTTFNKQTVTEMIDVYRKFNSASTRATDEIIEDARRRTGKDFECWEVKQLPSGEYIAVGSGKFEELDDEFCEDEECVCNENCQCECASKNHIASEECCATVDDYNAEEILWRMLDNAYPIESIVMCNYNPNMMLPGEWVESVDHEGYWKRTK